MVFEELAALSFETAIDIRIASRQIVKQDITAKQEKDRAGN